MSTAVPAALRPIPVPAPSVLRSDPTAQAFMLLRIAFTVAPIVFGLDKFAEVMIGDWPKYLAAEFNDLIPGSAQDAMYIVGGIEIVAGLVVLIAPRLGRVLIAGWLGGIIVSLLIVGGYGDIALRDFGLLLGALSLARLASADFSGAVPRGGVTSSTRWRHSALIDACARVWVAQGAAAVVNGARVVIPWPATPRPSYPADVSTGSSAWSGLCADLGRRQPALGAGT